MHTSNLDPIQLGCGYPQALLKEVANQESKNIAARLKVKTLASKLFKESPSNCLDELFKSGRVCPKQIAIELALTNNRDAALNRIRTNYIDYCVTKSNL